MNDMVTVVEIDADQLPQVVEILIAGPMGPGGGPVVVGGQPGDHLVKIGTGDFEVGWETPVGAIPITHLPGLANAADGSVDVTAALITAFSNPDLGSFYVPPGNYLIAGAGPDSGGIIVSDILHSLSIVCHPNAVFFTDNLDNDFFRLSVHASAPLPADGIVIEIIGLTLDRRNQKNSTIIPFSNLYPGVNPGISQTCDGISLRFSQGTGSGPYTPGAKLIRIVGMRDIAGDHWQTAGGDSAIFVSGGEQIVVADSVFQGARDLAVYSSTSGSLTVRGNTFRNCFYGVGAKRSQNDLRIYDNFFDNVIGAIFTSWTGLGDGSRRVNIFGNSGKNVSEAIRLNYTNDAKVDVGVWENNGALDASGATINTSVAIIQSVITEGAKYCDLRNGIFSGRDPAYATAALFQITKATIGAVDVTSEFCTFENIVAPLGYTSAGGEFTPNADNNRIINCAAIGASPVNPNVDGLGTMLVIRGKALPNIKTTATIAAGVITFVSNYMVIDTEASAATDDLDTINGGREGDRVVLRSNSSLRDITVKNGTGNINCTSDRLLDNNADLIELVKSATNNWRLLSFMSNA